MTEEARPGVIPASPLFLGWPRPAVALATLIVTGRRRRPRPTSSPSLRHGGLRRPDRPDRARLGLRRRLQPVRLRAARPVRDLHPDARQRRDWRRNPDARGAPATARRGLALRRSRARHVLHHRPRPVHLPVLARPRPPRRAGCVDHRPGHGPVDAQGRLPARRRPVDDGPVRHPRPDAEGDGARRPRRDADRRRPRRDLHRALLGRDLPRRSWRSSTRREAGSRASRSSPSTTSPSSSRCSSSCSRSATGGCSASSVAGTAPTRPGSRSASRSLVIAMSFGLMVSM